ncbi:MAG: phosphoribosyltransferase [Acidobacteria bacterium]|nr:phosphoribosyltransferase [Acidobacteriota bacterium]
MNARFRDRREAGRFLAAHLEAYLGRADAVVLALPRGGVPVGYEVAQALGAPLDVFLVRKLGVPGHEELAMGAIAEGGLRVINHQIVRGLKIPESAIEEVTRREQEELARRGELYRGDRPPLQLHGKVAILVDDGLATGASMRVAARAVRRHEPQEVVVAVPVAPPETCENLRIEADDVVCAITPPLFSSVGSWYEDFTQTSDEEVRELLEQSASELASGPSRLEE